MVTPMAARKQPRIAPEVLGAGADRRVRKVLKAARDLSEDDLFREDIDQVMAGMLALEAVARRRDVAQAS